jgi:ribosome-binding factor A
MTVAGHRHERVAGELQQEIGAMLAGELKDPRLAVLTVVSEVRVSPDLKHARVYVNVSGDETEQAEALKGMVAASGFIRHELCERLQMRRTPELHFVLDSSEEYGRRIEDLLRQSKNPG